MSRTKHLNALVLALFLTSIPGSLVAQSPTTPQAPSAAPSTPDTERDDADGWWEWRDRMREWMTGDDWDPREMMGGGRGRGPGMMWGGGMPMHSGMMPMMMMAMMDTNGNGTISYEEVEAVHRRMFNLVDKDKNGELSPEEIQEVMGWRSGR